MRRIALVMLVKVFLQLYFVHRYRTKAQRQAMGPPGLLGFKRAKGGVDNRPAQFSTTITVIRIMQLWQGQQK